MKNEEWDEKLICDTVHISGNQICPLLQGFGDGQHRRHPVNSHCATPFLSLNFPVALPTAP